MHLPTINQTDLLQIKQAATLAKFEKKEYTNEEYSIILLLVETLRTMHETNNPLPSLNLRINDVPQEKVQGVILKILKRKKDLILRNQNPNLAGGGGNKETPNSQISSSARTNFKTSQNTTSLKIQTNQEGTSNTEISENSIRTRSRAVHNRPERNDHILPSVSEQLNFGSSQNQSFNHFEHAQENKEEQKKSPPKILRIGSAPPRSKTKNTALPQFLLNSSRYEELSRVAIYLKCIQKNPDILDSDLEMFLQGWEERVRTNRFLWPDHLISPIKSIGAKLEKKESKLPQLQPFSVVKTNDSPEELELLEIGKIGFQYQKEKFIFNDEEQIALQVLIDITRLFYLTSWSLDEIKEKISLNEAVFINLKQKIKFLEQLKTPANLINLCQRAAPLKYFPELQKGNKLSTTALKDIDSLLIFYDTLTIGGQLRTCIIETIRDASDPLVKLASLFNTTQLITQLETPPLVPIYKECILKTMPFEELNSFEKFESLVKKLIEKRTTYSIVFEREYNNSERVAGQVIIKVYQLINLCNMPFANAVTDYIIPLFIYNRMALTSLITKLVTKLVILKNNQEAP